MIGNVALVGISLVTGWAALYPARRGLGPVLYHLAALPVGAVGWTLAASLWSFAGSPPSAGTTLLGLTVWATFVAAAARGLGADGTAEVSWRGYAGFGGALAALAGGLAASRLTQVGFDSYSHYELSGWYLFDTGHISDVIISSRSVLIPALHAADRLMGSDWTYVVYPVFSAHVLAILGWALWAGAFAALEPVRRAAATGFVCLSVALIPAWVFHTWFVHSNMVSAMYLTLSVAAVLAAAGAFSAGSRHALSPAAAGLVAGAAAAGLVHARPDGLAYAFVPLALLAVCHVAGLIPRNGVLAAYAGLLVPLAAAYGAAFHRLGLWDGKLQGRTALALLAATVVFGAATLAVPMSRIPRWVLSDGNMLKVAALLNVVLVGWLFRQRYGPVFNAVKNMIANLFFSGGWGVTWFALVLALIVSLLFPFQGPSARWNRLLLYAVFQFFMIAVFVHGTSHTGRVSTNDSFNRVALHVVPLAFWYFASYAGGLLSRDTLAAGAPAERPVEEAASPPAA
ncbi:MAG: hypothetical protein IBX62_09975 [Coriobacteriia bacterium]|nr:hypothetical protein [Coriobacteriia bacterium]